MHIKTAQFCKQIQGKIDQTQTCTFCQKEFVNKNTLANHTPHCVERIRHDLEEKLANTVRDSDEKLARLSHFYELKILEVCQQYEAKIADKNKQIVKLERQVDKHQESLTEIAKQKRHITNNTTNHNNTTTNIIAPLDVSQKRVGAILKERLDTGVVGNGRGGLAVIIHQNMLTDKSGRRLCRCTDAGFSGTRPRTEKWYGMSKLPNSKTRL
jgi:hypothetical protein